MKNKFKFLAVILATLMLVSFIPLATFAEEIETEAENTETDTAEPIEESSSESVEATSEGEISSDTENEETETMVFEFIEPALPGNSRMIGGGGEVGFGPPEGESDPGYIKITSSVIPDGVYSLQNVGNAGLWMDIEQSKTDAGYHVQQYAYSDNPAGTLFDRAGLFKISRKSNGLYVIRLMLNNRLSFGFVGNEVITKEIPTVDEEVPDSSCFTITYISGNYIIKPYNSSYAISAKNTTASGLSGAPDSYLAKRTAADAGDRAKWQMYKYTGAHKGGTSISYSSSWKTVGIPVGTTGTMSCKTWTTKIGANTPFKREAANSSAMISTSYDFTTFKMSFEALSPGKATIYSMILEGYTEPSVDTSYSYFQIIPQEGTYLIRNEKTEKYIDVKGPNTNEGTLIHQWTYGESSSRRWIVEHVSGGEGFVRIKSAYSDKYLAVDSTTNTTIKQTSTLNNYSLWKFERTSAGYLMLVCKALPTKVLALPSNVDNNGTNLTTVTYTSNDTYNDEWQIYEDVKFQDIALDIDDTVSVEIQSYGLTGDVNITDYSYTITSGSEYILERNSSGRITGLKSGTATVRATHKELAIYYTFEVKVNKNAIIIVPGMFGSELFAGENNPYYKADKEIFGTELCNNFIGINKEWSAADSWEEKASFLLDNVLNLESIVDISTYANQLYNSLSYNDDGSSENNVCVKKYKPPVESTNSNSSCVYGCENDCECENVYTPYCGIKDVYKVLYDALAGDSRINGKYTVEFFSYDWRLSNGYSAQKLDIFIDDSGYDKVILVAHSMGGLVASGYLALGEEQRNKTIDVYMLASPLLGTPETINIWANCDFSFVQFDPLASQAANVLISILTFKNNAMPQLISNYPSVYEVLPTEKYLDAAPHSYYLLKSVEYKDSIIPPQIILCTTYSASQEILIDHLPSFDEDLMHAAETFHNSCYDDAGTHVSQLVDSYYIYGIPEGTELTTLTQLTFRDEYCTLLKNHFYSFEKRTPGMDGDTLVPYWSSTLGMTTDEPNVFEIVGDHMSPTYSSESINYITDHILSN